MKNLWKKSWPHIVAIALFLALSVGYFSPIVFENKDLTQGDVKSVQGWGRDLKDYHEQTGDYAFWSNSMFSGMPANYTYMPPTTNVFKLFGKVFSFGLPTLHVGILFIYLLGFYLFMLALGCNPWLSIVGAIAYALGSYNLIIIDAGHVNKGLVMATMAPILAGVMLCYRKKYLIGALVTLVFVGINVMWSHQQISYYLLLMILCIAVTYFVFAVKEKTVKDFLKSSAILLVVAFLAVTPSLGSLIPTMDYTKETMRGGAVLQSDASGKKESSGLDIDYAYQWSYGKMESFTLLIPNLYGGNSHYNIGNESESYKALRQTGQAAQFTKYAPMYWGDQPFTSGPVYAGAIVCLLFVLGLIIVKGPERWWLLAAVIISLILSWGRNFAAVNEFLFHHLPLYNKFRTPSMSLVMAGVAMAALAILAVKEILSTTDKKRLVKPLITSTAITGGVCLLFALFSGGLFSFSAAADTNYPDWLISAIQDDRKALLQTDAWRSLLFIVAAAAIVWVYLTKAIKQSYVIAILGVLILVDLWGVDRRFLGSDNFLPKKKAKEIVATDIDKQILQDTDPDYRVLNLASNTFNESQTSYFHKSIGGYSPAKLRRYQDIIDYYFAGQLNPNVLNMLNAKYIIFPTEQGNRYQMNPTALGHAWFVDSLAWVASPDEEIKAIGTTNAATTAVIDQSWKDKVTVANTASSGDSATIALTDYANPGYLIYESSAAEPRFAVFSEVYYKTWKAYIDGVEAPVVRVNYVLRGLEVPAGNHKIEFKCVDEVYNSAARISLIASIVVGILIAGLFAWIIFSEIRKGKTTAAVANKD